MKRKILIISILTVILIIIISVIVYIQVQNKTKEVATLDNNISTEEETEETKDENLVTNEEVLENTEDRKYERMVSSLLFNADQKVNLQDKELYERVISIIQKYAREAEIIKLQKELINADEESQNELFEQLRELKKEGWV